ncbi:lipopolysaccharide biosynthesis protein [Pedobacter fastidiosus]|uniref:Lipopolysaccharide biosynthesis protein n=1 Tax=Pedobacter fastidiosus TaxID=2765361 RepID=A0ABR7KR49_9SPHI|nr:lipopolysaccharide biosynthesis protein [Pedobacter fastidiosus]MBC6110564.1 lipopolysaccharide biosynthesis protein [Pedobacter fastidiosus]
MTTESQQHKHVESDEILLKDLILKIQEWWRYLLSKWIIILIFSLLGSGIGLYYASAKKPIYTATTTFVLEEEKAGGSLGNLGGLASMAGIDIGGGGGGIFQGDNIFDLYKSRKMIEKTLFTPLDSSSNQTLMEKYIEINRLRESWKKNPVLSKLNYGIIISDRTVKINTKEKRLRDSVIGEAVNSISKNYLTVLKPDKKLSKVQVDVKSNDEIFSKCFNQAIVKNVNDFYVQTKTKKSLKNVQILQHKVDSVKAVMNGAIYTAVAVADATPNLNPTRQVQRVAPAQRAQFSAETNKAILSSIMQNLEMSKLALMKETPLLEIIDEPVYPLTKEKFGRLKGIIIGGFIAGFLICFVLIMRRALKLVLA